MQVHSLKILQRCRVAAAAGHLLSLWNQNNDVTYVNLVQIRFVHLCAGYLEVSLPVFKHCKIIENENCDIFYIYLFSGFTHMK